MSTHRHTVFEQFDPQADAYRRSAVHAAGPDLAAARECVASVLPPGAAALDVGCGAGHLSFALAPALGSIVALDPSAAMRDAVRAEAAARGLDNVTVAAGDAEGLPFERGVFDLVATRYSAHHWTDLELAVAEIRRVLAPGGYVLVIDIEGPGSALVDTHLQAIELLRDRSHVRNRSDAQWRGLFAAAGLRLLHTRRWPTRLEFAPWIARMRTPQARADAVLELQRGAPAEVREALAFEPDGSFTPTTAMWWAQG